MADQRTGTSPQPSWQQRPLQPSGNARMQPAQSQYHQQPAAQQYVIQGAGYTYTAQPSSQVTRGPTPGYTPASSSSGFSQHLQQHGMSPQQRQSPAPQSSSLARAAYKAKTAAFLDALPDDDVRRLFVVMYEKYATPIVAMQVQGKREAVQKKRDEARSVQEHERRAKEQAETAEVSATVAGVVSLLDDDDD